MSPIVSISKFVQLSQASASNSILEWFLGGRRKKFHQIKTAMEYIYSPKLFLLTKLLETSKMYQCTQHPIPDNNNTLQCTDWCCAVIGGQQPRIGQSEARADNKEVKFLSVGQ